MNDQELLDWINKYDRLIHKKVSYYYKSYIILNNYLDYEDMYSIAIEQVIKSSKKFKPELGYDFSTYSITSIENAFRMLIRKRSNQLKYITSEQSLDEPVIDKDGNNMTYHDYIKDEFSKSVEDRIIDNIKLKEAIEKIKKYKNMYEMLELSSQGYTTLEIGKIYGISQSYAARKIDKARNILKELL